MGATYVIRPEVAGSLGSGTELDTGVHPPRVQRLHYVFAGWSGDDIVETFPVHIVTTRLGYAISDAALTGVLLEPVEVTNDPQFVELEPAVAASLPDWHWLRVVGRPGDDFWLDSVALLHVSQAAYDVMSKFDIGKAEVLEA